MTVLGYLDKIARETQQNPIQHVPPNATPIKLGTSDLANQITNIPNIQNK